MDPISGTGSKSKSLNSLSNTFNSLNLNTSSPSGIISSTAGGIGNSGAGVGGAHSISTAQPQGSSTSPPVPASKNRAEEKKAKALSDAIDRAIRADKERLQKERGAKLLIL
ncbi:hypothetical protein BX616_006621, partial [Lobosporangium transversale]